MNDDLAARFRALVPAGPERCSLRAVEERDTRISVRRGTLEPVYLREDRGGMVTVSEAGGTGYAATADLGDGGLRAAIERAREWARTSRGRSVVDGAPAAREPIVAEHEGRALEPWDALPLGEKLGILMRESQRLRTDPRILDWEASLWHTDRTTWLIDAHGTSIRQHHSFLAPQLSVSAHDAGDTITRTFGGGARVGQGGLEVLVETGFFDAAPRIAEEALELLGAPDCPTDRRALLVAPDQMVLQLHESIGHPLELDRILGDERNYAGQSFVTLDMFGHYRYGSDLLNVVFDPTRPEELASYAYDDDGTPTEREFLIRDGILERPLGSVSSQVRAGVAGVANARATSWNRPPIDRMANLNLVPGASTLAEMIASVERGIFVETNCSWSIDDSRNKFQFGCERGRLIQHGRLGTVVKKPSYRGVSAVFWRNLRAVGDPATEQILGTPYCGKGEPNQTIRVGHAVPACLFDDVEVFGGA